jgi:hypothetical protein
MYDSRCSICSQSLDGNIRTADQRRRSSQLHPLSVTSDFDRLNLLECNIWSKTLLHPIDNVNAFVLYRLSQ